MDHGKGIPDEVCAGPSVGLFGVLTGMMHCTIGVWVTVGYSR